ncbi:hypothetical protein [Pseudomonas gingeri]|uniref:hypothetical protein n=1 Tax=Pseudomonas gingeri TaxID=117681 RepID=UPI00210B954B|nr:hypothetical protein [Pseudomonas gingeri]
MERNGLLGEVRFGVGHDDPQITPADKCRYDACVQVPEDFAGDGDATRKGTRRSGVEGPGGGCSLVD